MSVALRQTYIGDNQHQSVGAALSRKAGRILRDCLIFEPSAAAAASRVVAAGEPRGSRPRPWAPPTTERSCQGGGFAEEYRTLALVAAQPGGEFQFGPGLLGSTEPA